MWASSSFLVCSWSSMLYSLAFPSVFTVISTKVFSLSVSWCWIYFICRFCVAWYPVYRVPRGNFRAAFLTYHSLGKLVHKKCSMDTNDGHTQVVSPVVGLQSYNDKVPFGLDVFLDDRRIFFAYQSIWSVQLLNSTERFRGQWWNQIKSLRRSLFLVIAWSTCSSYFFVL